MSYILIKNISVSKANAMPAWWIAGSVSMIGMFGFVHNLARILSQKTGEDVDINSFGLVVHGLNVHGVNMPNESRISKSNNASFALPKATSPMLSGKNNPKGSPARQSMQPSALMDMRISLVLESDALDGDYIDTIRDSFMNMRILGGYIESFGDIIASNNMSELKGEISSGSAVFDASYRVENMQDKLSGMLLAASLYTLENRFFLSSNGYSAISDIKRRKGARSELHAYAEPIIGLNGYINVRKLKEVPMWSYNVTEDDCYIVRGISHKSLVQEQANNENDSGGENM